MRTLVWQEIGSEDKQILVCRIHGKRRSGSDQTREKSVIR